MEKDGRWVRPRTNSFPPDALVDRFCELAKVNCEALGLTWDGNAYSGTKNSKPHQKSLAQHSVVLAEIIKVAPTGFPAFLNLREVFFKTHEKIPIFPAETPATKLLRMA